MAQYRDDFSGNSPVGGAPTGWTKRWNTADLTATTVADANAEGGVVMRLDVTSDSRVAMTMDAPDSESPDGRANAELLVKFKSADMDALNSYTFGGILRGSGGAGSEQAYRFFIYDNNGEYRPGRYVAGASTDIATAQEIECIDPDDDEWYWYRMRVNGTTLSYKVWQETEPTPGQISRQEPPYWQYTTTDANIAGAGWIGILLFDTLAGPWDIAYVGVGTDGDTAPYPGGSDLQTLKMTQQHVMAAVQMETSDIRVQRQLVQVLVQLNTPAATGNLRRVINIAM